MRKRIAKQVGPVPIILAVFALAAFLSVGLLLTLNGNVTQAQGMPDTPPLPATVKCEVTVATSDGGDSVMPAIGVRVANGGCNVSGAEAVVTLKNADVNTKAHVAVYVTGGDEFPSIQATDNDGSLLGAAGVNEHLIDIDASSPGAGGIRTSGSESITVSRDMAKSGQVYVFAYVTDSDKSFDDGVTNSDDSNAGIPLSVLVSTGTGLGNQKFDARAVGSAGQAVVKAYRAVEAEAISDVFEDGDDEDAVGDIPANLGTGIDDAVGTGYSSGTVDMAILDAIADTVATAAMAEVDAIVTTLSVDSDYRGTTLDPVAERDGGIIKLVSDYVEIVKVAEKVDRTAANADNFKMLDTAIAEAEAAIAAAQATLAAIGDGDPQRFPNYTANVVVLVKFQDPAVEKIDADIVSKVAPGRVSSTGEAVVDVTIKDKNDVGLDGFVTLTIDAEAGADVVFKESNLKTHRVEVKGGTLADVATIEGLPKRGPTRVKVTANFNDGELVLEGYAYREGNPDMVTLMTYGCVESSAEEAAGQGMCHEEMAVSTTDETKFMLATSKLTESTVFGPGEEFLVISTVADAVGNKLVAAVSTKEKRAAGVTSDTLIFGSPTMRKKESRTVGTVDGESDAGSYEIEVASGSASMTASVIVSDVASMIMVSCVPEMIPTDSGLTDCTVTVTDAMGNIPSNLGEAKNSKSDLIDDTVRVAVRSTDVNIIGVDINNDAKLDADGMATFSVLLREDAPEGSITINVSSYHRRRDAAGQHLRRVRRPCDRTRNADERHGRGDQPRHDCRVLEFPRRRRRQRHHRLHGAKRIHDG